MFGAMGAMMRVVIFGNSGSGKSTLARAIAKQHQIAMLELDTVVWEPDNNRKRPWEPHKYESPEAQEGMLEGLLTWVEAYYSLEDQWSYAYHRRIFDTFAGTKREETEPFAATMPN